MNAPYDANAPLAVTWKSGASAPRKAARWIAALAAVVEIFNHADCF
jgi:hypothetical protein